MSGYTGKSRFVRGIGCALLMLAAQACSDDDSSASTASPVGRGSAACNRWQESVCAFAAQCSLLTRAECDPQAKAITCSSDQLASDCASSLQAGTCSSPPVGCDLRDLADPAPAVAACNQYIDAVCAVGVRCGGPTVEECRASIVTQVDCNQMLGYTLDFEACLRALETVACDADVPAICDGVLLR